MTNPLIGVALAAACLIGVRAEGSFTATVLAVNVRYPATAWGKAAVPVAVLVGLALYAVAGGLRALTFAVGAACIAASVAAERVSLAVAGEPALQPTAPTSAPTEDS